MNSHFARLERHVVLLQKVLYLVRYGPVFSSERWASRFRNVLTLQVLYERLDVLVFECCELGRFRGARGKVGLAPVAQHPGHRFHVRMRFSDASLSSYDVEVLQ